MKSKKMLAQAITLGLLLAVPFGAGAATTLTENTTIDETVTINSNSTSINGNNYQYNYTVNGILIVNGSGSISKVKTLTFGKISDSESRITGGRNVEANNIIINGKTSNSGNITANKTITLNEGGTQFYNSGTVNATDFIANTLVRNANNGTIIVKNTFTANTGVRVESATASIEAENFNVSGELSNVGTISSTNLISNNIIYNSGNINSNTLTAERVINNEGGGIELDSSMMLSYLTNRGTVNGETLNCSENITNGSTSAGQNTDALLSFTNIEGKSLINTATVTAKTMHIDLNISNMGTINVGTLTVEGCLKNREDSTLMAENIIIKQESTNAEDSFNLGNMTVTGTMTLTEAANFIFENEGDTIVSISSLVGEGKNSITVAEGTTEVNITEADMTDGTINVEGAEADKISIGTLEGSNNTINVNSTTVAQVSIDNNSSSGLTVNGSTAVTDSFNTADINGSMQALANTVSIADGNKEKTVVAAAGSVLGEITATTASDGSIATVTEAVNSYNTGISEMASIGLMTWRQENNDMNKRLGELRDSKGQHGLWARMSRGESKYGNQNIKNQYNYYQLGYDEKLSSNPNWTVGVALTYTDGESTFTNGRGENTHTGVAIYGSYLSESGSFLDLIAKYSRMDNEFKVNGGAGNGDYETNGYSISAEYGKRFTGDSGLWIEPQIELTYGYVGTANYLTSNSVSVRQDGMDSVVGRLGFSLGQNIKQGNIYVRASYLYDFAGETDVTMSRNGQMRKYEQDLGGGWWEVGLGTNLNLSEATHLYFDVEKTFGGDVATPWQWNAGVRWSF